MSESSSKSASFDTAREHLGKIYAKGCSGRPKASRRDRSRVGELDSLIDDVLGQAA